MFNLKLAFRTLFKTPFVTVVAILSLALGIGANAAIFSLFNQMLLRPLPVQEPKRLVNLARPGPKPGSQSCNQAGDCERRLQLPDVPRPRAHADGLHAASPRTVIFGANLAYQRPDDERRRHAGVGQLLPGPRPAAGARPAARLRRRPDDRRIAGRRPEPRLLADALRQQSERAQPAADRQRPAPDHRRRRAARASTARRSASSRKSSCRSRCAG